MKKIFLIASSLFALCIGDASAQMNLKQKEALTLGGNANKSTLSVAQIVDYPMLIVNDKDVQVTGFEVLICNEEGQNLLGPLTTQNAKLAPEMLDALEQNKGMKRKLKIQHIILFKNGKLYKEEALEYNIEQ